MPDVTIAALAEAGALRFGDGYRTKRSEHGQPGYRILRVADVDDDAVRVDGPDFVRREYARAIGHKLSQGGDILLTTKGTVGRVAIYPAGIEQAVYSPQLCFFRVIDKAVLHPRFLAYWFRSADFARQALHRANNTDMAPYINLRDIASLTITLPGIDHQRAMAEVLGALDDKIAANERTAELSIQLVLSLYRRAVMGAGSAVRPLFEVMDVDFGEPFKGELFTEPGAGRPLIRIRDLKTFRPQVWTSEERPKEILISPGDVVVGMDAEFRATWWLGAPGLLNQRVCRVRGKGLGSAFVACALGEPLATLEKEKSATTVIHLNKADLVRSVVRVPADTRLREFEGVAEALVRTRVASALEIARLAAVRDELLPLLMSGKLRVRDAEKFVEGVA